MMTLKTEADRIRMAVAAHEAAHCIASRAVGLNLGVCDAAISAAGHGTTDLHVPFVFSSEADARQVAVMIYAGVVGQGMLAPGEFGLDARDDLTRLGTLADRFGGPDWLNQCRARAFAALACNWVALQKTARQLFWTGKASWKDAPLLYVDASPHFAAPFRGGS